MKYPVEDIPNEDTLYFRVNKSVFEQTVLKRGLQEGTVVPPNVFRYTTDDPCTGDESLSANWSKYSSPRCTQGKEPEKSGVAEWNVGRAREEGCRVFHTPDSEGCNRAHSSLVGEGINEKEVRARLSRIAIWSPGFDLPVPDPQSPTTLFSHISSGPTGARMWGLEH